MSSQDIELDWTHIQIQILQLEQEGKVTRTFRRLDPDRQRVVIDAILDEAGEKGPTALNIKEVARRAEVSIGSLYQYFGNREGLLDFAVELCVRYMVDLFKRLGPMLAAFPLREALSYYLMGGIEWGQTRAGLVRFFGRAAYHSDSELSEQLVRPVATLMRATLHEILHQAAERGELRADLDFEAIARTVNVALIAFSDAQLLPYLNIYFQVYDKEIPTARATAALLDLIMNGIAK